ncbi:MAG: PorV/PorQ family protein [bacterium]
MKRRTCQFLTHTKLALGIIVCIAIMRYHLPVYGAPGTTRAEFLLIGVGGRATGMGEAFTAVADDVETISYNPAGLGSITDTQVTLMYNKWMYDISYQHVGCAHHIKSVGTFGTEIRYMSTELIGRESQISDTFTFKAYNSAATIAYGININSRLSLGMGIKSIREVIHTKKSNGFAGDIGALYDFPLDGRELVLGAAVQNIGPHMEAFNQDTEPLPRIIKLGSSYRFFNDQLLAAIDLNLLKDSDPTVNVGGEYVYRDLVAARLGYKSDKDLVAQARFNFGLGLILKQYHFDYTFVPFDELGKTHRFSLLLKF